MKTLVQLFESKDYSKNDLALIAKDTIERMSTKRLTDIEAKINSNNSLSISAKSDGKAFSFSLRFVVKTRTVSDKVSDYEIIVITEGSNINSTNSLKQYKKLHEMIFLKSTFKNEITSTVIKSLQGKF
ncbi:gp131 [Sphingomonas phage PAU]|uniref:gp131 n=1 Tax=Sphingomonas phage PAU TaxID=1150991 RepID=UPI0002573276|nr:gp131 [Sphingomonas phage PAU]AFF28129.1 gp131 [Sphingomonas phage PAU]